MNMLCQLQVKYDILKVFIVEYIFSITVEGHPFPNICLY
jgi:hypothetical protein